MNDAIITQASNEELVAELSKRLAGGKKEKLNHQEIVRLHAMILDRFQNQEASFEFERAMEAALTALSNLKVFF